MYFPLKYLSLCTSLQSILVYVLPFRAYFVTDIPHYWRIVDGRLYASVTYIFFFSFFPSPPSGIDVDNNYTVAVDMILHIHVFDMGLPSKFVVDKCSFMWYQPCQRCKYSTSVDIKNLAIKASHSCRITCERTESARERRTVLYKSDQQQRSRHVGWTAASAC